MAETVTDDEVAQARARVEDLRDQIADEKNKIAATLVNDENAYRMASLDAEATRLEAELAAIRDANSPEAREATVGQVTEQVAATAAPQPVVTTPVESADDADTDREEM
jgi:hypothetical protein